MEAAGGQPISALEEFLQRSLARMDHQDQTIEDMRKAVQAMVAKVSELSQRSPDIMPPTAPPMPPTPSSPPGGSFIQEPRLPIPEKYAGEPNYCRTFLSHCSLHFAQQPRTFFLEETKVAFTLSLLKGKAALWGTAVWENKDSCCSSFASLAEEMKREDSRSVPTSSGVHGSTHRSFRRWSLRSGTHAGGSSSVTPGGEEAAEIPGSLYVLWRVGSPMPEVPGKRPSPIVRQRLLSGRISAQKTSTTSTLLPVRLRWSTMSHSGHALLDSGAEGNFIDSSLARKLKLPFTALTHQIAPFALNGHQLPTIKYTTAPITLITSGNHTETISFFITDTALSPIVLGHPWLHSHNPRIDWKLGSVTSWSEECHKSCLVSACVSVSESVFQGKAVDLSTVPAEYHDLKEVFSKSRADSLPPHRPYDCAIDLLPDSIVCSVSVLLGCSLCFGLRVSVWMCIVVVVFVWMFRVSLDFTTAHHSTNVALKAPTSTVVIVTIAINNTGLDYFRIDIEYSLFVYI
ncbi:uncharacterized protein [Misgurnus anguillicaudatus]|uniref:uncharacterized protein n=1 Tax=Misgurnus anguillicaudatus TaxID=75329 RepID=UPI003CCF83F6